MTNVSQSKGRFGAWLRDVREAAGLSQADVARALGCSNSNISYYECGHAAPRREFWQPMADLFGVELEEVARAARGWREVLPDIVLPRLADPGHATCENGCAWLARCRAAVALGLPAYCEDIDERDVLAAQQTGTLAALMARAGEK
jgi:transcriptional regulator with XRE-family HTH domain